MNSIHIIARKNGVGIDRDVMLMEDLLSAIGEVDWRSQKRPESIFNQIRARFFPSSIDRKSSLYILTERLPALFGRLPGSVALVPNQERFPRRQLRRLRHVDRILCKTRHAEAVFGAYTNKVKYIGFTSLDRNMVAVSPDYGRFFHLAGRSDVKGTDVLLDVWSRHPEWPELTIVQASSNKRNPAPNNVRLVSTFVDDDVLQIMQNEIGIHICPSRSEGWGHYIVEAMSCGAVALTTDGPPMNELVTSERGILIPWYKSQPRHLGTDWYVDPAALEKTIQQTLELPEAEKRRLGNAAKSWYAANDAAFRLRLREAVCELLSIEKDVDAELVPTIQPPKFSGKTNPGNLQTQSLSLRRS